MKQVIYEIDISECETYEDILAVITDWTDYYNNERYQWDLAKASGGTLSALVSVSITGIGTVFTVGLAAE